MKIVNGEIYKKLGSGTEVEVTGSTNMRNIRGQSQGELFFYQNTASGETDCLAEEDFKDIYIPKYLKEGDEVVEESMGRILYSFKVDKIQDEWAICSGTILANPVLMVSVSREINIDGSLEGDQSRIQGSRFHFMDSKTKRTLLNKRMKESYNKRAKTIISEAIDKISFANSPALVEEQLDSLLDKIIKATKEIK